jgi:ABC-type oligopeptide transport system substrate-binding subunit
MYDRSNAFRERLATLLESDLARVGIELVVQPMDSDLLYARLRSGLFDCILTGFRPPAFPDPSSLWTTHGYWNGTGYSSVVVDSLCATIRREEDAGRLRRHVRRLESLLRRSGPVTFLVSRDWVALIGPQVQGFSGRADDPLRGLEQVQPRDRASRSSR